MAGKVFTVDEIRENLVSNDKWLVRGLLAIYAKQTADEKSAETTSHNNGVGFNGTDANILSSFAKQVLQWQSVSNPRYPSPLSPKQFDLLRRKMVKYAGQLVRIAEQNNPVGDVTPPVDPRRAEFERKKAREIELSAIRAAEVAHKEKLAAEAEARAEREAIMAEEFDAEPVVEFCW